MHHQVSTLRQNLRRYRRHFRCLFGLRVLVSFWISDVSLCARDRAMTTPHNSCILSQIFELFSNWTWRTFFSRSLPVAGSHLHSRESHLKDIVASPRERMKLQKIRISKALLLFFIELNRYMKRVFLHIPSTPFLI